MMRLRMIIPVLSVALLTIAAILPWGLPTDYRFVLPLLPIVAIYYFTLDGDAWLPEWVVFLAGLLLDVLTQGPLGYWALVYLVAYVVAVCCSRVRVETMVAKFALLGGAIIAITTFAWFAASFYSLEMLALSPYVLGAGFALLAACLAMFLRGLLRGSGIVARPMRLTRGD